VDEELGRIRRRPDDEGARRGLADLPRGHHAIARQRGLDEAPDRELRAARPRARRLGMGYFLIKAE